MYSQCTRYSNPNCLLGTGSKASTPSLRVRNTCPERHRPSPQVPVPEAIRDEQNQSDTKNRVTSCGGQRVQAGIFREGHGGWALQLTCDTWILSTPASAITCHLALSTSQLRASVARRGRQWECPEHSFVSFQAAATCTSRLDDATAWWPQILPHLLNTNTATPTAVWCLLQSWDSLSKEDTKKQEWRLGVCQDSGTWLT